MSHAISTHRLTKYYGRRAVVRDLELNVPTGAVYGLLGRNGAGKSTTLKMLLGMVKADYGHARLLGDDCAALSPATRARVAYLAEGHPLYGGMTVGQLVDFSRPFHKTWNSRLVEQVLDHFALSRKAKIGRLSKGQRAQVALVVAIAPDPEVLILDDPTLGLDPNVRRDFLESMIRVIQRRGRTILFSSHILGDVERVADRVGVMIDGALRVDCGVEHFKQSVRKVVVEFAGPPPAVPVAAGLVGDWQVGTRRELVYVGLTDGHLAALDRLNPRRVQVMELSLEDAFIEYTRGPRRELPIFAGDELDDPIAHP